jgi:hypothetical protein
VSRGPDREFLAQTIPARIPPPDPRVRHFANPETDTVVERPERRAQRPPAGRADRIFGNVARVGLVLLVALICAALVTWRRDGSYYSSYYRQYYDYVAYQPLRFHNNTQAYSSARTFLIAIAFAGVVLILLALISARRAPAGRLALIGAGLLSFGLFALELAIHSGASVTAKKGEMQYIALLGAALLLVGCWRGLAPSKGNQLRFLLLGIAVLALAAAPHLVQYQDLWVLSQGGGGIISGLALIAAALMLNGRGHSLERSEFARR